MRNDYYTAVKYASQTLIMPRMNKKRLLCSLLLCCYYQAAPYTYKLSCLSHSIRAIHL